MRLSWALALVASVASVSAQNPEAKSPAVSRTGFRFEAIGEGARQMIGARLVRAQHHDDQVLGAFVVARGKPAISVHSVSLHDEPVASVTS